MDLFKSFLTTIEFLLKYSTTALDRSFLAPEQISIGVFHHIDGYSVFGVTADKQLLNRVVIDRRHFNLNQPDWLEQTMKLDRLVEEAEKLNVAVLEMEISEPIPKDLRDGAVVFTQHDD
jgi:hypothetical protein